MAASSNAISRALFLVAIGLTAVGEMIALTGIVRPFPSPFQSIFSLQYFANPFVAAAWAGAFLIQLSGGETRTRILAQFAIAAAWASLLYGFPPSRAVIFSGDEVAVGLRLAGLLGIASIMMQLAGFVRFRGQDAQRTARFLLSVSLPIFLTITPFYLALSAALRPGVWDMYLRGFDGAFGFHAPELVSAIFLRHELLAELSRAAYLAVPLLFAIAAFVADRNKKQAYGELWVLFLLATLAGYVFYFIVPACGPRFLAQPYPESLAAIQTVVLAPFPRNCVPSLHMTWALLLWWNMRFQGRIHAAWSLVAMVLTVLFMLGSGEHYLVDLTVSIPFTVAVQAGFLALVRPDDRRRLLGTAAMAAVLFVLWLLFLRLGAPLWTLSGVAIAATAVTLIFSAILAARVSPSISSPATPARPLELPPRVNRRAYPYYLLFIGSGFAALVYEVAFAKALALAFGGTALATYTVLMTYMGGLALGAWLGGMLAEKSRQPLKLYAGVELAIGAYCGATIWITPMVQQLYVYLASDIDPAATSLNALRVTMGGLLLGIPTVLMGVTLPLMTKHIHQIEGVGRSVGGLYSANTAGAAFGALIAGYALIPILGMKGSLGLAVILNLAVAGFAIRLWKQSPRIEPQGTMDAGHLFADGRKLRWIALTVLTVGGMSTLGLEVTFIHLLAVVAGNSAYAFSLMLFAFLIGLCGGAAISRHLLARKLDHARLLFIVECGLGFWILLTLLYWDALPAYFASFQNSSLAKTFAARELVRALVCLLAMMPPAFLIGMVYPIAMQYVAAGAEDRKMIWIGRAASLNTVGNIAGVALTAFVLVPALGAYHSTILFAVASVALGLLVAWKLNLRLQAATVAVLFAGLVVLLPKSFDYTALSSGANVYFQAQHYGRVIDHVESPDGGLTSVALSRDAGDRAVKTLLTNGKFQGDNSVNREMAAQFGFALTPLLHTAARNSALVIGYGTGVSARALSDAGFAALDIVELSDDVFEMADRHFSDVNGSVRERPGVSSYVTDGRNFLLLQERQYDLISMEISSIWFAGAGSLYNREFYRLAKKRLKPDGVLQQWVQLHRISNLDVLYIIGTLRSEFRHVHVYFVGNQGIVVASNEALLPSDETIAALESNDRVLEMTSQMNTTPRGLLGNLLLSPAQTDLFLESFTKRGVNWVSTDDNLFLEYSTPKGNVRSYGPSLARNLAFIREHSVPGQSAGLE